MRQLLLEHGGLAGQRALAAHQLDGVVAKDHGRPRHFADLVLPLGLRNLDLGIVGGKPVHAVGEIEQRIRDRAADVDEGRDHHHAGNQHDQQNEPDRLPVSDAQSIAGDLGVGHRAVGELAERVARGIVGDARGAVVDRERIGFAAVARQLQHLVDDRTITGPPLLEPAVQVLHGLIVPDVLEAALGCRNGAVEIRHVLLGRRGARRVRGQKIAALDSAKVRSEIVEIAERASGGQPDLGHVRRQQVEIAQPPDAEHPEHGDQRKEQQEYRGEMEADRLRLPHQGDHQAPKYSVAAASVTCTYTGRLRLTELARKLLPENVFFG